MLYVFEPLNYLIWTTMVISLIIAAMIAIAKMDGKAEYPEYTVYTMLLEQSIFENNPGKWNNVTFGVYSAEDIMYKDTVILRKDSLIAIVKPSVFGHVSALVYNKGKYYLKEFTTDENYLLNDQKHYFEYK